MTKRIPMKFLSLLCVFVMTATCALAEPEVIVPDAYAQTGTLPVYRATARDFGAALQPEMFNASGIAERGEGKHRDGWLTFADGAKLSWCPEAVYYTTYDGTWEVTEESAETGERVLHTQPRPSMAGHAADMALWMLSGWPDTGEVFALESTALTDITLAQAQEKAEVLLAALGLEGYTCEQAIDMSLARILTMGGRWNALIDGGVMPNQPPFDVSAATAWDEGYLLVYHRFGTEGRMAGMFRATVYVTAEGFPYVNICDQYAPEGVVDTITPVAWEQVVSALPGELASAREPLTLGEITRVRLTWCPSRAERPADGMVLTPVWVVRFTAEGGEQGSRPYDAVFDATDGRLMDGDWM